MNKISASGEATYKTLPEMNNKIGSCYVLKKSFERSVLPIYKEIHKLVAVTTREGINRYVANVMSIKSENEFISINNYRAEFRSEHYYEEGVFSLTEKDHAELEKYYLDGLYILFSHLDEMITDQLTRNK